jgi:hypothetical protein
MDAYVIMDVIMDVIINVIMDVIMVYNGVIMGIKDTLFTFITFVIMVYNGVIMESRFADVVAIVASFSLGVGACVGSLYRFKAFF